MPGTEHSEQVEIATETPAEAPKPKHGGARKGAGRKPGAATQRTRAIADRVIAQAEENATPLEVMLKIMRSFMQEAEQALASTDPDERQAGIKLLGLARDAATAAAPYIHPKLASVDQGGKGREVTPVSGVLVAPPQRSPDEWETENNAHE